MELSAIIGRLPVTAGGLPPDEFGPTYAVLLEEIEGDVRAARARARRTVTGELVGLYWRIGNRILDRQASQGWGAKVIDRLAADLKAAFPDSRGFSRSNLEYMRRLAASHPDPGFPQQPAGELPWGHWMVLLDKLSQQHPERPLNPGGKDSPPRRVSRRGRCFRSGK